MTGERRWQHKATGLRAEDIMATKVVAASSDEHVSAAARRMLDHGIKRLPVIEDGRLVGIVSRHDVLRVFHRSDSSIAEEIEMKLSTPRYAPADHTVVASVADGVVTLTGEVEFSGEVPVVEGLAWSVRGVVHVVSDVTYQRKDGQ